jgi:uncharacterized small protein (DUF1192 family)
MSPRATEIEKEEKMPKKNPKDAKVGDDVEYGAVDIIPLKADGSPEPVVGNAVLMQVYEATVGVKTYNVAALEQRRANLVAEIARIDEILAGGK